MPEFDMIIFKRARLYNPTTEEWVGPDESAAPVANDGTFFITEGATTSVDLSFSDPDGTVVAVSVDAVSNCTVSYTGGGTVEVTSTGSAGTDAVFEFTVADNDGLTATGTMTGTVTASGGARSFTIEQTRSSGLAPATTFFEAKNFSGFDDFDNPEQDCLIVWDFDDAGAEFADLSGRLDMLNTMDATQQRWNDANKAYGFFVSHVYRTPGTYSVQAHVYYSLDQAPVSSNVLTFTAQDPATEIPLANTVYASNDGNFPEAQDGAVTLTTSDASDAWNAVSSPRRLIFKGGDTFTAIGNKNSGVGTTVIESAGTGRAIWDITSKGVSVGHDNASIEFCMKDIICQGTWSMNTISGTGESVGISWNARGYYTFDNVLSDGSAAKMGFSGGSQWQTNAGIEMSNVGYIDCEVRNRFGNGWYGHYYRVSFLGSCTLTPLDAYHWNNLTASTGTGQRIESFNSGFWCCTDMYNPYGVSTTGHQPPYKLQGDANLDAAIVMDRVIAEGNNMTNVGVGSSTSDERQRGLYDKFIHIADSQCGFPISVGNRGTTVRNVYAIRPFSPNWKNDLKNTSHNYLVNVSTGGTNLNQAARMSVHSCTYAWWQDTAAETNHDSNIKLMSNPNFGDTESGNSIIHAPFDLTPQVADVDTSVGAGGIAFYPGRLDTETNGGVLDTTYETPDQFTYSKGGVSLTDQYTVCIATPTGDNLSHDAADPIAFDYIDGTLRGSTPAKGAFKP